MARETEAPNRHSFRLPGFNYAQAGAYFITVGTYQRHCMLGEMQVEDIRLSEYGTIANEEWLKTGQIREKVFLDQFVIMPNHLHGILFLLAKEKDTAAPCPYKGGFSKPIAGSLPTIVGAFKSAVTKRVNDLRGTPAAPFWQQRYYEHVIRNEEELDRVRQYILTNPLRWALDRENPDHYSPR